MAVEKADAVRAAKPSGPSKASEPALPVADLARAILERTYRPRVADVRRLAEAVLAADQGKGKKAKAKGSGKKKAEKKRKLAKIPSAKKAKK